MSAALPPPATTRRIVMTVGGLVLSRWTSVKISRNLRDIAGSFTLEYRDAGREALAFDPDLDLFPRAPVVLCGQACSIAIDGTVVLVGWIEEVDPDWEGDSLNCTLSGRDVTGDLVDCAAAPNGPVEYRDMNCLQIAQRITLPFAISSKADVDVGGTFPLFGVDVDEVALSAIAKAARQQALLVVSDGVGNLLLTRGGNSRAPAPLTRPGNIAGGSAKFSWAERFSDYYVKGQTNRSVIRKHQAPAIVVATDPTSLISVPIPTTNTYSTTESTSVLMTGHAIDPEIKRYRPTVRQAKTQAGAATVQQQADWSLRIAKGMGDTLNYRVMDWRAGPPGAGGLSALWLPNALSKVTDAYAGVNRDMLISGVTYQFDQGGAVTMLELAGKTAFDRIDEPADDPRYIIARKPKSFGPTRNG